MKHFALIFTLMLVCNIPQKLTACEDDQDSTVVAGKKNFDNNIPEPTKKTKTILFDALGNDLTHKIKKVFLNDKQIQIHEIDSIKARDIKSITMKQVEKGDIWLYIETLNHPDRNVSPGSRPFIYRNKEVLWH